MATPQPAGSDEKPFELIELGLKVFGACSAFTPLLVNTLNLLPVRPSMSSWLPWLAVALALPAALLGLFVKTLNLRVATIILGSSVALYVVLVLVFPQPLVVADALLRVGLALLYLAVFSSFSFLVAHLVLAIAKRLASSTSPT
jgi:hypothetical protein